MVVDHICFAVRDIGEGIRYWVEVFGYAQMTEVVENTIQHVKVVFLTKGNSILIKLIEPTEENESLKHFVFRGGGFHHICFKCSDVKIEMANLSSKGLITLAHPQPGEAFNNHEIAFMLAKYGLNIELIDTDEKARLI